MFHKKLEEDAQETERENEPRSDKYIADYVLEQEVLKQEETNQEATELLRMHLEVLFYLLNVCADGTHMKILGT